MRPRIVAAAIALAAAAGAAAGCGEEGAQTPEAVAQAFVSTNDASKCGLVTPALLERQTGRRGADARRFCEANVQRERTPSVVRVLDKEVHGNKAEVELLVDDREERLQLVRTDGSWRIASTSG